MIPAVIGVLLVSCEDPEEKLTGTNPSGSITDVSNRITGFSPEIAGAGTELKVLGSNLSGVRGIYMGTMWINDFETNGSEISFTVPANMTLGENNISFVFTGNERATKTIEVVPIPTISYYTPKGAGEGDEVTIIGNNLSFVTTLSVSGVTANITSKDNTMIKFTMPAGATTGTIDITNSSGNTTSSPGSIVACSDEPSNLICQDVININGSFEDATLGEASSVNGWGGLTGSLHTGVITNEEAYDGFNSYKVTVNEIGANPWNIQPNSNITVDPTATYHVSMMVKGSGLVTVMFAVDEGGTPGYNNWQSPQQAVNTNEWTEISYEFSPTSEAIASGGDETARFAISMSYDGNAGGVMYFDNLRVVKVQ